MFLNPEIEINLKEKGYLVLDLFTSDELKQLDSLSKSKRSDLEFSGLSYSLMQSDNTEKEKLGTEISKIIESKLNLLLNHFQVFGASYIVKMANGKEEFSLHQDWSYTDEQKYEDCYTIWIPLQNTTPENGCMYVLPGSHKFFNNYRSATLETSRISVLENSELSDTAIPLEMKRGEVLFFKQALFHGSFPNKSSNDRVCAVAIIKNKNVPLYYYQKANEKEVLRYSVNENLFINELKSVSQGNLPSEYSSMKTISYAHVPVTNEMLMNKINR